MGSWLNFCGFEIAISRDRVTFELHLNCIFLLFKEALKGLFQMSLLSRYSDFLHYYYYYYYYYFVIFVIFIYLFFLGLCLSIYEPHTHTHTNITKSSFSMKSISNIELNKQNRAAEVLPILSVWDCISLLLLNKLYKMLITNIIPHAMHLCLSKCEPLTESRLFQCYHLASFSVN